MAYKQQDYSPQQSVTFHNLQAGVKYRVRVRAVDGEGNVGAYSNPVDIIAGIGNKSQLNVSGYNLSLNAVANGVHVNWDEVPDTRYHDDGVAAGYELYFTQGSSTPPDPTPGNAAQLRYQGNGRYAFIPATSTYYVKVLIRCYDIFGRYADPADNEIQSAQIPTGGGS